MEQCPQKCPKLTLKSVSFSAFWPTLLVDVFLGRVALVAQRPIVVKLSHRRSVGLCVGRCVHASACLVHCGKTADRIRIPFSIISRTSPGIRQVVGFGDRSTARGTFRANLGRAIVTMQLGLYGLSVRQCRDAALFQNYFGQTCCHTLSYIGDIWGLKPLFFYVALQLGRQKVFQNTE